MRTVASLLQCEAAFLKCWAERSKEIPAFAGLTREAAARAFAAE